MPRYIAFLRAINVGGHTVKMDALRQIFESLGLASVETFIASGNVIFETNFPDTRALEKAIETKLHAALGYAVATFLRTDEELAAVADYQAFSQAELDLASALNVIILSAPLDDLAVQKVAALTTDIDSLHVHGREIYWLCLKKQSESTFSNAVLEKALKQPSTMRSIGTLQRLAKKYAPEIG